MAKSMFDTPIQETEAWKEYIEITNKIQQLRTNSEECDELYSLVERQHEIEDKQYAEENERWRQTRLKELEKAQFEAQAKVDAIIDD